jgi:hypothetical protein
MMEIWGVEFKNYRGSWTLNECFLSKRVAIATMEDAIEESQNESNFVAFEWRVRRYVPDLPPFEDSGLSANSVKSV